MLGMEQSIVSYGEGVASSQKYVVTLELDG